MTYLLKIESESGTNSKLGEGSIFKMAHTHAINSTTATYLRSDGTDNVGGRPQNSTMVP